MVAAQQDDVKAPNAIEMARLIPRKPTTDDAEAAFARYASDAAVTRSLQHRMIDDTRVMRRFSRGVVLSSGPW